MYPHIKKLLLQGESDVLDFKQSISSASKIAKTMSAFANHKGGRLLIGVRDNKSISGIRSEDEKYMLDLAASFYCKPEIPLQIVEHEINGKTILECIIRRGDAKPYFAKTEDGKWLAYIRVKDNSVLASKVVVDVLRREQEQQNTFFEYSNNEERLIKYLSANDRITLNDYKKMVNISKWRASRILVNLISAGIIRNHTTEKAEYFTLA